MTTGGSGRVARLCTAVLVLGLASCGGGSTGVAGPATPKSETTTASPTPTPSGAPVDDPATAEIEVAGELLAQSNGDGECTSAGDVERCLGAPWEGDYSMSDPRLSGHAEVTFNREMAPDRFRWWYSGVLRTGEGAWEGLNTGQIKANEVHVGDGVFLGTGSFAGLEFHEHLYMGPGADTSRADTFEVTGWIHPVAVDGWNYDPAVPTDGLRQTVRAVTTVWSTSDGDAARTLYARDAVFLNTDGATTVGRAEIAALIEGAAEEGFHIELLPPVVVHGNYTAAAFHWTSDTDQGWVLGVFRFDEEGRIVHHEVIG